MNTITIDRHRLDELKHNAKTVEGFTSDLMAYSHELDIEGKITLDLLYTFVQKELKIIDSIATDN